MSCPSAAAPGYDARMHELFLGIDSATTCLSLALWSPGTGLLADRREQLGRQHARRIVGELELLFERSGKRPAELTGIACGIGPGSYTGLRIGLATGAGLARALGVPMAGCDTLAAMAAAALAPDEVGIATLDARRDNVYAGVYRRDGDTVTTLSPAAKLPRTALARLHPGARLLEGVCPDAAFIARNARAGVPAAAIYL